MDDVFPVDGPASEARNAPSSRPPIPHQRAAGRAMVDIRRIAGRSRIAELHQSGCLKLRFPSVHSDMAEAILINSSGGLTGGDRLGVEMAAGAGAALSVTTQSCERVYRSSGGEARVALRLRAGEGASLFYLPQETILFDGGAIARTLDVECAASSRLILAETVLLGRTLMGETVRHGHLHDRWRIRRGGRLVHADDLRFSGGVDGLSGQAASLAGARAFSTILVQMPGAAPDLPVLRALVGARGGVSAFEGLVLLRLVANTGFDLRKRLVPLLSALAKGPLPLVWSL